MHDCLNRLVLGGKDNTYWANIAYFKGLFCYLCLYLAPFGLYLPSNYSLLSLYPQPKHYAYIAIVPVGILLTYLSRYIPFFWDNVLLASKIAHFYYDTGFATLILPNVLDSGHPPFYGLYLAIVWTIFGHSLPAAHWAMLPFFIGMCVSYYRLLNYFLPPKYALWGLLILPAEAAIFTQSVLAGIDIPIVWAHLLLFEGLLYRRRVYVAIGALGLCLFSLRGIITASGFVLCDILLGVYRNPKRVFFTLKNSIPAWLPAALLTIIWYAYHYKKTGFVAINQQSAWATAPDNLYYEYADIHVFLRNIAIIGWHFLEQGRFAIWLIVGYVAYQRLRRRQYSLNQAQIEWLLLCFLPLLVISVIAALRHNPIMTRYFLAYFLLMPATALYALTTLRPIASQTLTTVPQNIPATKPLDNAALKQILPQKTFLTALFVLLTAFVSGHFWIYPYPIANSWDTTLRCLPYFEVQQEMYRYMNHQNIPFEQTASAFPLFVAQRYTYVNSNDLRKLSDKTKSPINDFSYFCLSNISNEFKPADIAALHAPPWHLLKRVENKGIWIELYRQAASD